MSGYYERRFQSETAEHDAARSAVYARADKRALATSALPGAFLCPATLFRAALLGAATFRRLSRASLGAALFRTAFSCATLLRTGLFRAAALFCTSGLLCATGLLGAARARSAGFRGARGAA